MSRKNTYRDAFAYLNQDMDASVDKFGFPNPIEYARRGSDPAGLAKAVSEYWTNSEFCRYAAKNENTSLETLKLLATHPSHDVKMAVAGNRKIDSKTAVRFAVAGDEKLKCELVRVTPYENVKSFVLKHNFKSQKILNAVLRSENDESSLIRGIIDSGNLEMLEKIFDSPECQTAWAIMALEKRMQDSDFYVLTMILDSEICNEEIEEFISSKMMDIDLTDEEIEAIKRTFC